MIRTAVKTLFLTLSVLSLLVLLWFGNAFFGNPLSYLLASQAAKTHLVTTYPGTDFYVERIAYSFKDGDYHAFIKSPSSIDTHFSLDISMLGKVEFDTYSSVPRGFNTARRLNEEYRSLTAPVFADPAFPPNCHIGYGTLEIHPDEAFHDPAVRDIPPYAINQKELVVDKIYNIPELGKRAGRLHIYVDSDIVTAEQAAQIMLDIKTCFDRSGVPFMAMDFTLQYPPPDHEPRPDGAINVSQFLYADIYEDGMADRVAQADRALNAYYAQMDATGK